jgi:hypothetical protein
MSTAPAPKRSGEFWASAWVSSILVVSAALALGYRGWIALGPEDVEALESPLVMSAARQLTEGPAGLYGPFGGKNPWVLIHAPLYYRLTALAAWPLRLAGLSPVAAALVAGRTLSFLGLLATLVAGFRLARIGGLSRRAGWWSVLLIASSPVLGAMPVAVRPDMVGVALQTVGVLWLVRALQEQRPKMGAVVPAYIAFGLAACVKQHFVVEAVVSTGLVLVSWLRGRISRKAVERALPAGLLVVLLVYGAEELATQGHMSRSVLEAASRVAQTRSGGWVHVRTILIGLAYLTLGSIPLLTAAAAVCLAKRPGWIRSSFVALVGLLTAGVVALRVADVSRIGVEVYMPLVLGNLLLQPLLIGLCVFVDRRRLLSEGDAVLWICVLGEILLLAALSWASTGAWLNYAIQASVFIGVLTARLLDRAFEGSRSVHALAPIALGVLLVPLAVFSDVRDTYELRAVQQYEFAELANRRDGDASQVYFDGRPGMNRVHGRPDLVYDDWLYPIFESSGLAEPRSSWLRRALTNGSVRWVVCKSENPRVAGIEESLQRLGYLPVVRLGESYLWERRGVRAR